MTDDEVEVIPIIEERLQTSKVKVETGRVQVRTVVEERQEVVREQLRHENVDVERVSINLEITEVPPVREEGDMTIIPIVQEVLVVQKKLMLVEEVRLRRRSGVEEVSQPVTIKVQRAVVERTGEDEPIR